MNAKMEEVISTGDFTLISYKGNLTAESLDVLFQSIEEKLNVAAIEQKKKKKIYYIAVECLQNVYRHAPFHSIDKQDEAEFAIILRNDNCLVVTGNCVRNKDVDDLALVLDSIINNDTGVQQHYRERLSEAELSEKGGAGLGFIDIKRKAKSIRYSLSPLQDDMSYFLFEVLI